MPSLKHLTPFVFLAFAQMKPAFAQDNPVSEKSKPVVSILLPLYLDSLFQLEQYKYGNSIPKFSLPYLEFYNGVELAADYLRTERIAADIRVVDIRKYKQTASVAEDNGLNGSDLLIGVAQNTQDLRAMAQIAQARNIPMVSATFPNDAGVKGNPNLIIVNPTLKTHCQSIYRYAQDNHSLDNIIMVTRKGTVEPLLKSWLDEAADASPLIRLKWKVLTLADSFKMEQLQPWLDSNRNNLVFGVTMDTKFANRLIEGLSKLQPSYTSSVMGMPNWDELELKKPELKGVEVIHSTAFAAAQLYPGLYNKIAALYTQRQKSKPSDMVMKGFEVTYRFIKTFAQWPDTEKFMLHINDPSNQFFGEFNFEPVTDKAQQETVHYLENKKLYFIKRADGVIKSVQ